MTGHYMETQIINQPITYKVINGVLQKDEVVNQMAQVVNPVVNDLSHHKLLSCLYFIFDAFERSGLDFFLVRDTAKKAMTEYMLEGDHLDIGVRKLEWASDSKDLLFPYFDQERVEIIKELPDSIEFRWQDVPFTLHLYDDNPCVTALIPIVYEHEHFKIPNQFERFEKEFDK